MSKDKVTFKTIDEYISTFPKQTQDVLEDIRKLIKKIAPDAQELITYQMPTFELGKNRLYFAAFKKHIGFYAIYFKETALDKKLEDYRATKDTIQFKLDQPIPYD